MFTHDNSKNHCSCSQPGQLGKTQLLAKETLVHQRSVGKKN